MSNLDRILDYIAEAKKFKYSDTLMRLDLTRLVDDIYNEGYNDGYEDCRTEMIFERSYYEDNI